jgi:uncharacterized protein (TIGR02594 family)
MTEPKWLILARENLGQHEISGGKDNPTILQFYKDAGHPEVQHEDTAWCAAFVGAMLKRAGVTPSGSLLARSYLKWGVKLSVPKVGCIAVLWRGSPTASTGHVGFYVGENGDHVKLLGGNQGDGVSIASFPKARVLSYRWQA